jgi:hypothetical protein
MMHKTMHLIHFRYIIVTLLFLINTSFAQKFSAGMLGGSNGGPGMQLQTNVEQLAKGFPFILRFGIAYTDKEPGNASAARKIFINNATNGIPEKKGRTIDARLDFMYNVNWFSWNRLYFVAGPRVTWFKGNFKYVGGNEDFDVKSKQWGLGVGLEKFYNMSPKIDLILCAGFDYYAKSTLQGHDTSYSPDGETVNGREDYQFEDADKAINQPYVVPRAMIGVNYRFGK